MWFVTWVYPFAGEEWSGRPILSDTTSLACIPLASASDSAV
ncbi:MAG: hypothetical protein ABTQ28_01085 [Thauera sp.]